MNVGFNPDFSINNRYSPIPAISFGYKTVEESRRFKRENGLPEFLPSNYKGYTGPKKYNFPTSPFLEDKGIYPDITEELDKLKGEIFETIDGLKKENNKFAFFIKVVRLFRNNFEMGDPWDTKYLEEFPGVNKEEETQYAMYKGRIVSANYISNNLYGQVLTMAGFSPGFSKLAGKAYSRGGADLLNFKIPSRGVLKFRDPPEDQDAIESGYYDYKYGDPWRNPEIDPKRPYPAETQAGVDSAKPEKPLDIVT